MALGLAFSFRQGLVFIIHSQYNCITGTEGVRTSSKRGLNRSALPLLSSHHLAGKGEAAVT